MAEEIRKKRFQSNIIYFLLIAVIVLPLLVPFSLPLIISDTTRNVYRHIEAVPEGGLVLFVMDISPGAFGELADGAIAVGNHLFSKPIRILGISGDRNGPIIWDTLVGKSIETQDKVYGEDYVYLGFLVSSLPSWTALADDISSVFENDHYGNDLSSLPMMENIRNHDDIDLIVTVDWGVATGPTLYSFIGPYNIPWVCVYTGLMSSQYIPYYPNQINGMVVGITGAAEYELLIKRPGMAASQVNVVSMTHIFVILLLILGNIQQYVPKLLRKPEGGNK